MRPAILASFALLALAACGSAPPTSFLTLLPPAPAAAATPAAHLAWEVLPVALPAQADQPQFALRRADGTLVLLEHDRWIAPLADELRAALLDGLSQRLGPPLESAGAGKLWRIRVDVQRFDSGPGGRIRDDIDWALSGSAGGKADLQCRSVFDAPAGDGAPALAAAHREAVAKLAQAIAVALEALDAGRPASCPTG